MLNVLIFMQLAMLQIPDLCWIVFNNASCVQLVDVSPTGARTPDACSLSISSDAKFGSDSSFIGTTNQRR